MVAKPALQTVLSVLSDNEILYPSHPQYSKESQTWAMQGDLKPKVVVRPTSVEALCRLVTALKDTDLEFGVRSGGNGNASAKDVLISMTAFDSFESDMSEPGNETVTIGTGQWWEKVDRQIEEECPGFATISPRCSFLAVGGPLLLGGLSWLSSEKGMACAPGNLIDALVVKMDGTAVWAAKEDPELMWALRGGGGSFGIVVKAKVRIWKYPKQVFTGRICYPRSSLPNIAKEVAAFSKRCTDPKLCLHLYGMTLEPEEVGAVGEGGIVIFCYDVHGEDHARSEEGFAWALNIPGAVPQLTNLPVPQLNSLLSKQPVQEIFQIGS